MALKQATCLPLDRSKTKNTKKKKSNKSIKNPIPNPTYRARLRYCDNLPKYWDGTPNELPLTGNNPQAQVPLGLEPNVGNIAQVGSAALNVAGGLVGNNDVATTVDNTHGDTFEGLMSNQAELNAAANKGIDKGNVTGSALSTAGQMAGAGAGIGTMIGGPVGTAIGGAVGAVAGGVTGLFTGRSKEKDRINALQEQARARTKQAEQVKLNNLNSNVPTYQMANGGKINPMVSRLNYTIPNENIGPPDTLTPLSGNGRTVKSGVWQDHVYNYTPLTSKFNANKHLNIPIEEYDLRYKENPEKYTNELVKQLNDKKILDKRGLSSYFTSSQDQNKNWRISEQRAIPQTYREDTNFATGGNINRANNNAITKYTGETHEGPDGGIPIDQNGNPTVVTGNKPVALTENGEVNFKGYIFSNRIKYK